MPYALSLSRRLMIAGNKDSRKELRQKRMPDTPLLLGISKRGIASHRLPTSSMHAHHHSLKS